MTPASYDEEKLKEGDISPDIWIRKMPLMVMLYEGIVKGESVFLLSLLLSSSLRLGYSVPSLLSCCFLQPQVYLSPTMLRLPILWMAAVCIST